MEIITLARKLALESDAQIEWGYLDNSSICVIETDDEGEDNEIEVDSIYELAENYDFNDIQIKISFEMETDSGASYDCEAFCEIHAIEDAGYDFEVNFSGSLTSDLDDDGDDDENSHKDLDSTEPECTVYLHTQALAFSEITIQQFQAISKREMAVCVATPLETLFWINLVLQDIESRI